MSEDNSGQVPAASSSEETESTKRRPDDFSLIIFAKKPSDFKSVENFLRKRDWQIEVVSNLKDGMAAISANRANWVLISVNMANTNVERLPGFLTQTFSVRIIGFAEEANPQSNMKLTKMRLPIIQGKLSGPSIQTKIKNIIASEQAAQNQLEKKKAASWKEANESNIRISSKNSGDGDAITVKSHKNNDGNKSLSGSTDDDESNIALLKGGKQKQGNKSLNGDLSSESADTAFADEQTDSGGPGSTSLHQRNKANSSEELEHAQNTSQDSEDSKLSRRRSQSDKNEFTHNSNSQYADDTETAKKFGEREKTKSDAAFERARKRELEAMAKAEADAEAYPNESYAERMKRRDQEAEARKRAKTSTENDSESKEASGAERSSSEVMVQKGVRGDLHSATAEGENDEPNKATEEGVGAGKKYSEKQKGAGMGEKMQAGGGEPHSEQSADLNPTDDSDYAEKKRNQTPVNEDEASAESSDTETSDTDDTALDKAKVKSKRKGKKGKTGIHSAENTADRDIGEEEAEATETESATSEETSVEDPETAARKARDVATFMSNGVSQYSEKPPEQMTDEEFFFHCVNETLLELSHADNLAHKPAVNVNHVGVLLVQLEFVVGYLCFCSSKENSIDLDYINKFSVSINARLNSRNINLVADWHAVIPLTIKDCRYWAENYCHFGAIAMKPDELTIASFVEMRDPLPNIQLKDEQPDKGLVRIETLIPETQLPCDFQILLPETNRSFRYLKTSGKLTFEQQERWEKKQLEGLYIARGAVKSLQEYFVQHQLIESVIQAAADGSATEQKSA